MIFPACIIAGFNIWVNMNTALPHYTLADLICLAFLMITYELDALIVGLSLSKDVFVRAE